MREREREQQPIPEPWMLDGEQALAWHMNPAVPSTTDLGLYGEYVVDVVADARNKSAAARRPLVFRLNSAVVEVSATSDPEAVGDYVVKDKQTFVMATALIMRVLRANPDLANERGIHRATSLVEQFYPQEAKIAMNHMSGYTESIARNMALQQWEVQQNGGRRR